MPDTATPSNNVVGLKPARLELTPNAPDAAKTFMHWIFVLKGYLSCIPDANDAKKLAIIANCLTPDNFELIADATTFDAAITTLTNTFVKPPNEIVARYKLATHRQSPEQSIDDFLRALHVIGGDCNYKAVSSAQHREESIRGAFISGLNSHAIRTRLLEKPNLSLDDAVKMARALEIASKDATTYSDFGTLVDTVAASRAANYAPKNPGPKCGNCGLAKHRRSACPARDAECRKCHIRGHWEKVCRSSGHAAATSSGRGSQAHINVKVDDYDYEALVDTGSTENFVSEDLVRDNKLNTFPYACMITMANKSMRNDIKEICFVNMKVSGKLYPNVRCLVMKSPVADIILGDPFHKLHKGVRVEYGGNCLILKYVL